MRTGFPHSEICGSTGASPSSQLIAACYVLHRLRTPRHPPDALALTLDRSALVSHARRRTQDMERDHWIEILRSTGVQTGQSRLHFVREQNATQRIARIPQAMHSKLCCSVDERLRLIPGFGGADRDRTDDLKLAKLALSQLSYGPSGRQNTDVRPRKKRSRSCRSVFRAQNGGPGTS